MKVFIGSSSESLAHAETVAQLLRGMNHEPWLWTDPGIFRVGKTHVEDLEHNARQMDAAVFVFGEDDQTIVRGKQVPAVRANVLFEYGLYSGRLGQERTCIVLVGNPDIAADFSGIKHLELAGSNAENSLAQWLQEIGPKPPPLPKIDLRQNLQASLNNLLLERAQSSLFISGVSNAALTGYKNDLLRRSEDIEIRLLITDLKNRCLQDSYKDLRKTKDYEDDTTGLMTHLARNGQNIQIKVADFIMPTFFVASDLSSDPAQRKGTVLAFHTFCDTSSSQRPSVMVTPEHEAWFDRYRAQIELIWEKARPFQADTSEVRS